VTHARARHRYWEVDDGQPMVAPKMPYRIELVGVTCDPGLAVARGIWCARARGRGSRAPASPACLQAAPPSPARERAALGLTNRPCGERFSALIYLVSSHGNSKA